MSRDLPRPTWRKSSYSANNGGNCVEVAHLDGTIGIRDTKQRGTGPVLTVPATDFAAFISSITTTA